MRKTIIERAIVEIMSKDMVCRAWDVNKKEMIEVYEMGWGEPYPLRGPNTFKESADIKPLLVNGKGGWKSEDGLILMWHFGHVDEKGKKVFEGDIVEFCDDGCYHRIVVYSVALGGLCLMDEYGDLTLIDDEFNLGSINGKIPGEVVGNIFQNPELLEYWNGEDSAES